MSFAPESALSSIKALTGYRVQRLDVLPDQCLCLELFDGSTKSKSYLVLDPQSIAHAASVLANRVKKDESKPPSVQKVFRQELVPSKLVDVHVDEDGMVFSLNFLQPGGKFRTVHVEISSFEPRLFLTSVKPTTEKVIVAVERVRSPRSNKGSAYQKRVVADAVSFAAQPLRSPERNKSTDGSEQHRDLIRRFRATRKRYRKLREALHGDLEKHRDSQTLYNWGEALKPFASQIPRGRSSFSVVRQDGGSFEIPLTAHLDGIENLDRLFRQAKRALKAHENIHPRLKRVEVTLEEIDTQLDTLIESEMDDEMLGELEIWLSENDRRPKKQEQKKTRAKKRKPYRQYLSMDQIQIWVGRKAKDNDVLTFRHASGNDTFFHVRGQGGSHVIVKTPLHRIQPDTLIDAAHLALWFSRSRGSQRVDVQYTERKHVRRAEGGKPGLVYVSNERVMHLVFDERRIQRLVKTES